jgi:N utilization substance protein B
VRERSRARGWALQVLYAWESRGDAASIIEVLREFETERRIAASSRPYLSELIRTVARHREEIDKKIQEALTNWRLERLAAIDRNILRLAAAELYYLEDIPPLVSIQQAISLAEKYGTAESPRFINGVLDALLARLEGRS